MNEIKKQLEDLGFVKELDNTRYFTMWKRFGDFVIELYCFKVGDKCINVCINQDPSQICIKHNASIEWITDFDKLMSHK